MAEIITYVQSKSSAPPPFSPTDIAGLQLWLKADAGVTLNGSTVSAWADQSGNWNDATQATASYQPTFVANALNGKPVLRFEGSNDFLNGILIESSTKIAIFCVAKVTSYDNFDRIYALKENGKNDWNSGPLITLYSGSSLYNYEGYYDLLAASGIITSFVTYEYVDNGSNIITSYINGNIIQWTSKSLTYKSDEYYVGAGNDDIVRYFFNGDFAEIIIYYGNELSDAQRQQVEQYLQTKYAHY
jgi:hypothetical protein